MTQYVTFALSFWFIFMDFPCVRVTFECLTACLSVYLASFWTVDLLTFDLPGVWKPESLPPIWILFISSSCCVCLPFTASGRRISFPPVCFSTRPPADDIHMSLEEPEVLFVESCVDILVFFRSLSVISVPSASFNAIVFWFEVQKNIQMANTSSSSRFKTVSDWWKDVFCPAFDLVFMKLVCAVLTALLFLDLFSVTWPLITRSVQTLPFHSALKCPSLKLSFNTSKWCYFAPCSLIVPHLVWTSLTTKNWAALHYSQLNSVWLVQPAVCFTKTYPCHILPWNQ